MAPIASSIDVTAITEIQLTGKLTKGDQEVWRYTVSKQIVERDKYGNTQENTERSMGNTIGEVCKELVTEMAKYLSQN